MSKNDQIISSLNKIQISESRKNVILKNIIALYQKQIDINTFSIMKRKKIMKLIVGFAAISVVIIVVLFNYPGTFKTQTSINSISVPQTSENTAFAAGDNTNSGILHLKKIRLDTSLPTIQIPKNIGLLNIEPIQISDKELKKIADNLNLKGWSVITQKPDIKGLYEIMPHNITENTDKEYKPTNKNEHFNQSMQFMKDSGLIELYSKYGINLNLDKPSNTSFSTCYWSNVNGYKASGYVRINLSGEHALDECKMNIVKNSIVLTAKTVPFDIAKNNIICFPLGRPIDEATEYIVKAIELKFIQGIPMYELTFSLPDLGNFEAYELAVPYDIIKSNATMYEQYQLFLKNNSNN